jgi:hypothetical protein
LFIGEAGLEDCVIDELGIVMTGIVFPVAAEPTDGIPVCAWLLWADEFSATDTEERRDDRNESQFMKFMPDNICKANKRNSA